MLRTGIIGALFTALCCFTPLLVWILGALGLGAVAAWLDIVLIPMLIFFIGLIGVALWKQRTSN